MQFSSPLRKNLNSSLPETFERIRLTTNVSQHDWFDILQVTWLDYQKFKLGKWEPVEKLTERIGNHFNINSRDVLAGNINYSALAMKFEEKNKQMPERFSKAAFNRMRTSISSVNFLENVAGWRLRLDVIRRLDITEKMLQDPFAPISIILLTDLCDYLSQRQFQKKDFFEMGAYTFESDRQSLVPKLFSEISNPKESYEFLFNDCMNLWQQTSDFKLTDISNSTATVEFLTNRDAAAEVGIRHLGSAHVCQIKLGCVSNVPRYSGRPAARVKELACVHRGDDVCRFELDFSAPPTLH